MHEKTRELQERTHRFFIRVIALCDALPRTDAAKSIGQQLIDSAGSTDSNYRAACRGRSKREFIAKLAARGETPASHRGRRGAPLARRDDREYREYLSEEQRRQRGCIAGRMQLVFHHGLLGLATEEADECKGWLSALVARGLGDVAEARTLVKEADELIAIFVKSQITAKRTPERRRRQRC